MSAKTKRPKKKPSKAKAKAKSSPADRDMRDRLGAIMGAGKIVAALKKKVSAQEAVAQAAKSTLSDERETLSELNRELSERQEDLDRLSIGGFAEHLPFGKSQPKAKVKQESPTDSAVAKTPEASNEDQEAFNAAPVSEILKGLGTSKLEKLESDGIKTGKDLQAWLAAYPPRTISGIGEQARGRIGDLCLSWYDARKNGNGHAQPELPMPQNQPTGPSKAEIKKAHKDLMAEMKKRMTGAGWKPTGLKQTDQDTTLKLVRRLAQDEAVDASSVYEMPQLDAMRTRLDGMTDAQIAEIVGVETVAA